MGIGNRELYLVRHGESVYNAEGRIQGQQDAGLSELGFKQAELIARRLASFHKLRMSFDAVYSSDLSRASATAEVVARWLGLSVQTTPLLRESKLGVVEGLTDAEVEERYPDAVHHWRKRPLTARPPGAESIDDVIDRARRFLDETLPKHADGSRLLVIGHGGSVRGVTIAGLGLPAEVYRKLHFSNAALSIINLGDDPGVWLLNDTCHLRSLATGEEEL